MEAAAIAEIPVVEMTRVYAVPRQRVYAAWTEAEALAAWMGPGDTQVKVDALDLRPGGAYRFLFRGSECSYPLRGEFIDIVENERLSFTWCWEEGDFAGVETLVELTFSDVDGGTELTLIHSKMPSEEAMEKHTEGWNGCLACLTEYLSS